MQLEDKGYQKGLSAAAKAADQFKKKVESQTKSAEKTTGRMQSVLSSASGKVQAALGKVGGALDNLSGGRLRSAVTAISGRLGPALTSLGSLASRAGAAVAAGAATIASAVATAATAATAAAAVIAAGFGAITVAAFKLAQTGAPLIGIQKGFEGLTSTIEGGAKRMLASLQDASAGMVANTELMQKFNLAAQLVGTQFAQQLPDAMGELQKVAFATGQDIDFLLNSLIVGVGRLSPLILDNLSITVDTALAYETWAEAQDRSVQSMTKAEKQAALMNQVMENLRKNTANLPEVVGSAQQAFQGLRTDLTNIRQEMAMRLAPAFADIINGVRSIMPAVNVIAQGMTETFIQLLEVGKSFGRGFMEAMGTDMESIANNAEGWGANISISLARGIAAGASAIISVLNAIGNMIANWLAPGSPPKLLPDIDDWGTAAMNEYLMGMTDADVGVLRGLSGKLENFIRSLGGDAEPAKIAETILEARQGLEDALAGSGDVFKALPPAVHGYAQALLDAEAASKRVERAQERLNEVTEMYRKRLQPLDAELDAIHKRRQEVIDQQRKTELESILQDVQAPALAKELAQLELREIQLKNQKDAVEEERDVAVSAAQDKLSAAQQEEQAARERLQLEEQLLQHQIETNNLLKETVKNLQGISAAAAGAAGGGGAGGAADALQDKFEDLAGGVGGASSNIEDSIGRLKQKIIDEFAPIKTQAEELGRTWGRVSEAIGLDTFSIGGFIDNTIAYHKELALQVAEKGLQIIASWQGIEDKVRSAVTYVVGRLLVLIDELKNVKETWQGNWELMQEIVNTAREKIGEKLDGLGTKITEFKNRILSPLTAGFENVRGAIARVVTWLGNLITKINNFPSLPSALAAMIRQSPPPLARGMKEVRGQIRSLTTSELPMLQRQMGALQFAGAGALGPGVAQATTPTPGGQPIQIGPNYVRDEMDMRRLEAIVRRNASAEVGSV